MGSEVKSEFDKIWAIIHAGTVRANEMERRWNEAHAKAMARMDRAEARMDRADERFEKKNQAIQKLILAGMKMLAEDRANIKRLEKSVQAFVDSLRNTGNGNGHRRIR